MAKNNLIFSLSKSCEEMIKNTPEDAAAMMANLISAHAAIRMRAALDCDKFEASVSSWIIEIQSTCEGIVGDAINGQNDVYPVDTNPIYVDIPGGTGPDSCHSTDIHL